MAISFYFCMTFIFMLGQLLSSSFGHILLQEIVKREQQDYLIPRVETAVPHNCESNNIVI